MTKEPSLCQDVREKKKDNLSAFSSSEYDEKIKQTLPFADDFEVVTAIQVFHYFHADDRKEALKRCYEAYERLRLFGR